MGNIGGGVADVIMKNSDALSLACGENIEIKYILDLRDFPNHPLGDKVVHSIETIINDPEVGLVCETMGGSHPAYEYSTAALRAGKHVVTSNKEVVANFGDEFTRLAEENGVHYLFEASVGGGIPLIRPITDSLRGEKINEVNGIVNGTTNYILTKLGEGSEFDDVLKKAQELGYAEPNPTADLDAIDAQRKICILSALATGRLYDPSILKAETIRNVTPEDMTAADTLGGAIKLIAHGSYVNGRDDIFAAPCFVPYSSPLSHITDVYNGILVDASVSGELMFFGRGAGKYPTAGSILADVVSAVSGTQGRIVPWHKAVPDTLLPSEDHVCRHFITFRHSEFSSEHDSAADHVYETELSKLYTEIQNAFGATEYVYGNGIGGILTGEARHGNVIAKAETLSSEKGVKISVYRVV